MDAPLANQPEREWSGFWGKTVFAEWSGRAEVLAKWDSFNERVQASLKTQFERYAELGVHNNAEDLGERIQRVDCRRRGGDGNWRACIFRDGKTWVITHFYYSPHTRWSARKNRVIAVEIRAEHLERQKQKARNQ